MVILQLEVLDLELDLAAAVPLVDRGCEGDRAERAGLEHLAAFGHVPGDRLDDGVPLAKSELQVVLPGTDRLRVADDLDPVGDEDRLWVANPVRLESLDRLENLERQGAQRHLGVDQD